MYRITIYNDGVATIIQEVSTDPAKPHLYSATLTEGSPGEIDSVEFTMLPNNPGYDLLYSRTTTITVLNTKTGFAEFEGRVLTVTPEMQDNGMVYKSVVCESRLGYLCDSIQPYVEEQTYALEDFFKLLLENHNSQVEDYKKIYPGTISVTASASTGNVTKGLNYQTTWEALKEKLLDTEGGEMQLYTGTDGLMYLDYIDELGSIGEQTIELGKNMRSIKQEIDPTEVITRLIPLGAKLEDEDGNETEERLTISSVNGGVIYLDDEDAQAIYGIVTGIVEWENVTEASNLLTKAQEWLDSQTVTDQITIDAVDLWLLGLAEDSLERYNYYRLVNSIIGLDAYFRVVKRTVNLLDPADITYELGSQSKSLASTTTTASNTAKSASDNAAALQSVVSKTVASLIAANAEISNLTADVATIKEAYIDEETVGTLLADYVKTEELEADVAEFGYLKTAELDAEAANLGYLKATDSVITNLISDVAVIADAYVTTETVNTLLADYVQADELDADVANLGYLKATDAEFTSLSADVAAIKEAYISTETVETLLADYVLASELEADVAEFGYLKTSELDAEAASLGYLKATDAEFTSLSADVATIKEAYITTETVSTLLADYVKANELEARVAEFGFVTSTYLSTYYLTAEQIESAYVTADTLTSSYIDADTIASTYIMADLSNFTTTMMGTLLANAGLVTNMTVENEYVTGELSSVTINADLIKTGTLSVERLLIVGEDGIIYQINAQSSGLTEAELTDEIYQNYINGTVIVAKSVTADQIAAGTITATEIAANSITADRMDVSELSSITADVGLLTAGILMSQNYVAGESGIYIDLDAGTIDCEEFIVTASERILSTVSQTYATLEDYSSLASSLDDAVVSVVAYFAVSSSADEYPDLVAAGGKASYAGVAQAGLWQAGNTGWVTQMPSYKDGEYVWMAYLKTYADGSTEWTEPALIVDGSLSEGLASVTTTTASLEVLANEILQVVTSTNATWYTGDYAIAVTSCGAPDDVGCDASLYKGLCYLDQTTGYVYLSDGKSWEYVDALEPTVTYTEALISTSITNSEAVITSSITQSYEKYVADVLADYSTTATMENYITQTVGDSENSILEYVAETYATPDGVTQAISASIVLEILTDSYGNSYGAISANADYVRFDADEIAIYTDDLTLESGNATFSGALSAASGTFAGELVAVSGTFAGELVAAYGTFKGDLEAASGTFGTITGGILVSTNYVAGESGIYIDLDNGTIDCASLTAEISEGLLLTVSQTYATLEDYSALASSLDDAVMSVVAYFAVSSSADEYPDFGEADGKTSYAGVAQAGLWQAGSTGWTTQMPLYGTGDYVWMAHLKTYTDGTKEWTEPALIVDGSLSEGLVSVTETTASLKVLSDSILQAVTATSAAWYTGDYVIAVTSCGTPGDAGCDASLYGGLYYLDQTTGYVYLSDGESWTHTDTLEPTTTRMETLVEETATGIKSTVSSWVNAVTVYYGTCTTAADESYKTITCDSFDEDSLAAGASIRITFAYGNTSYPVLLNINGTGYVPAYADGTNFNSDSETWGNGATAVFEYDGTVWNLVETGSYSYAQTLVEQTAESWSLTLKEDYATKASLVLALAEETDESGTVHKYGTLYGDAEYIKFTAGQFAVEANNFSIDEDGDGTIGSWSIGENALYNGTSSIDSWDAGAYVGTDGIRYVTENDGVYTFVQIDESGLTAWDNAVTNYLAASAKVHYRADITPDYVSVGFHSIDISTETDSSDYKAGGILMGKCSSYTLPRLIVYGYNGAERMTIAPFGNSSSLQNTTGYINTDLIMTVDNNLTVTGTFDNSSDARLKEDFTGVEEYDQVFDALIPTGYRYKKGGGRHTGFIYQDVHKALEDAGIDPADSALVGSYTDWATGEEYGTVSYIEIIALLVAQVQSLKARVAGLESMQAAA